MKISKKFSKIKEESALVLVTGKQDAAIYSIGSGHMERIDAFKIPKPKYSDNEGHFKVRRRGKTLSSGSMREASDKDVFTEFLRELKTRLKSMSLDFDNLYLFVPSPYKNEVRKSLPVEWRKKIEAEIMGNYYYRSPENLLQKIEESKQAR